MRWSFRGSKVVRFSAGAGVYDGGILGRELMSVWRDWSTLVDSGVEDSEMSSSSEIVIVELSFGGSVFGESVVCEFVSGDSEFGDKAGCGGSICDVWGKGLALGAR